MMKKLPAVQRQIETETAKVGREFKATMLEPTSDLEDIVRLPERGMAHEQVLELAQTYLGCGEFDWKKGTFSGTVYNGNEELTDLMTKVYGMAAWTNPLHPDAFPGVRKMEAEIVKICCDLFNVIHTRHIVTYNVKVAIYFSYLGWSRVLRDDDKWRDRVHHFGLQGLQRHGQGCERHRVSQHGRPHHCSCSV